MYIQRQDLLTGIYEEDLITISRDDDTRINDAIREAIDEARTYLTARYNMDAELVKTGSSRNNTLIRIIRDIAIYNIYRSGSPANMPDNRRDDYKDRIKDLERIRNERTSLDGVERLASDNSGSNYLKFGANPPRKNHY